MRLVAEIRFAARSLLRQPLLVLTVAATVAIALAFNVATTSVLTALLQRPFPYPALDRLILVRDARPREGVHQGRAIAAADFYDLERSVAAFESLAAYTPRALVITNPGADPERVEAVAATANFFSTLGIVAAAGRVWDSDADRPGHDGVVLLSRRLWHSRFGGDPSAVGRDVSLNGRRATIAGIVRDEECYPAGVDAWVPLVLTREEQLERNAQRLNAIARIARDASIPLVRAQLGSTAARLATLFPLTDRDRAFDVLPLRREQYEFTAPLFSFVQAAAILVLALALINVTNLLVARVLDRRQELAIRAMLGASRRVLAGLIIAETAIMTTVATAVGLAAAYPTLTVIRASLPEGIARWINGWSSMHIDRAALAIGLLLGAMTTLLVGGIVAASASRASSVEASPSSSTTGTRTTRRRLFGRRAIVAGEIALAASLLLCASVVVQGFTRLATTYRALAPDRLLRFTLTTPAWRYPDDVRVSEFHARVVEALDALPGVRQTALIRNEPASNVPNPDMTFQRGDTPPQSPGEQPRAGVQIVSAAAFDVLRIKLVDGRVFLPTDTVQSARVAVVSREAVRRYWTDRNPIGTVVQLGADRISVRIVGVVDDLRLNWYDPVLTPVIYLPDTQSPARSVSVIVRTRIDPPAVAPLVRAATGGIDSLQPIAGLEPLSTTIADSLSPVSVIERLLIAGAIVAALLAAVGVFAILAQSVSQRRREFGVRFALGATPASIARTVLEDAASTAAAGIAAGLTLAVSAVRIAQGSLLGLAAIDVYVVLVVVVSTAIVVGGAALAPARRAARVDVGMLLRLE